MREKIAVSIKAPEIEINIESAKITSTQPYAASLQHLLDLHAITFLSTLNLTES